MASLTALFWVIAGECLTQEGAGVKRCLSTVPGRLMWPREMTVKLTRMMVTGAAQ